ncbi:hypothetical protein RCL_jg13520.t1 [Rhizophagus clarus]|uniref:Uncharacterized protein n=1 Tax=Rhizophagus clarus TaxID=94130 RepID=A0A8H3QSD9_9GLOM|nr:hypothetical protein RCL_jg13520.t1 [Rhizophagus clarus]
MKVALMVTSGVGLVITSGKLNVGIFYCITTDDVNKLNSPFAEKLGNLKNSIFAEKLSSLKKFQILREIEQLEKFQIRRVNNLKNSKFVEKLSIPVAVIRS